MIERLPLFTVMIVLTILMAVTFTARADEEHQVMEKPRLVAEASISVR